jgi:DNA modification methylase
LSDQGWRILTGDCRDVMATLPDHSVDSVVCDPPYELNFMGKKWDSSGIAYDVAVWSEALRVLKPGGHLIAFGSSRTYHRLASAIEDAGFQIRDQIQWLYGTGFPKSLDVSKAIDKAAGVAPSRVTINKTGSLGGFGGDWNGTPRQLHYDNPSTEAAKQWSGWGTALKPGHEPAVLARKPLIGTVAQNVSEHGTGALNIDACRVGGAGGRWPANVCHDDSDEITKVLGHAARFFYSPKASKAEREAGLESLDIATSGEMTNRTEGTTGIQSPRAGAGRLSARRNVHPTVKPISVMKWCLRMVTPPAGLVLDPFTGSGSTGCAAVLEGFHFIGIDISEQYAEIARLRVAHHAG